MFNPMLIPQKTYDPDVHSVTASKFEKVIVLLPVLFELKVILNDWTSESGESLP